MADNLYRKLLNIMGEVGKIEKTGRNTLQGYAFTEQSQVVAALRPVLHSHGVMIIPETVSRTTERFLNAKGTITVHANVSSRFTLVNADDPAERMVCEWDAGEAFDTSDKATNKATTASHKSFLMKLFNISDKDDPDVDSPTPPHDIGVDSAVSETMSQGQIIELMDLAKKKGSGSKDEAVAFLDDIAGGPFSKISTSHFAEFKKRVISAGWKKPNNANSETNK